MEIMLMTFLQFLNEHIAIGAINNFVDTIAQGTGALRTLSVPIGAFMLVVAGIMWFVMGEQGPARAKKIIIGVCIGLVIIFGADTIANWVKDQAQF